ncbi:MAG: hypothetical protein PHV20_09275 [Bacteroidales bacterium]|nr:hypothetical protein [Bacteroidales bacterium]
MSTFDKFELKTNPFRMTPSINSEELIWAGFPEVKEKIENRIKRSIKIPNSSLILNWGEYGSGKTHAARYFNKLSVLEELAGAEQPPFSLDISFPKSKEPVKDIYVQIIDKLDISILRKQIVDKNVDPATVLNLVTDNMLIRNVVKLMFDENIPVTTFKSYLYGTSPINKSFVENGIQRKLVSDNDYTEFLSTMFSLITYQKEAYSCVILWIDEFEDISILNSINISNVNNFIRTIIDKTPNNLLMFLNLTQSAMMDVEDLGEYLQEAVKSRIKDRVELSMPTKEELKVYLKDLLNHSLHREEPKDSFFPFEENVVDEIVMDLGSVSLRRFNEAFSLLIESAMFDDKASINKDYYESMKSEIIGWKN